MYERTVRPMTEEEQAAFGAAPRGGRLGQAAYVAWMVAVALWPAPFGAVIGAQLGLVVAPALPRLPQGTLMATGALVVGAAMLAYTARRPSRWETRSAEFLHGPMTYPEVEVRRVRCTGAAVCPAPQPFDRLWFLAVGQRELLIQGDLAGLAEAGFAHEAFELRLAGWTYVYEPEGPSVPCRELPGGVDPSLPLSDGQVIEGTLETCVEDLARWQQAQAGGNPPAL